MKKTLLLLSAVLLFGYEAKVEPFDTYKIKSSVAGSVVLSNKNLEAVNVKNGLLVRLDTKKDMIDLNNLKKQAEILKQEIKNQEELVKRKKEEYETYKNLKTKSKTQKNLKFYDYINAYNQLLNLKSNLQNTIASIDKLKDTINKKNIKATGYVYKIYPNVGDYLAPGVVVADVYNVSKEKIILYVPLNEKIKPRVYINGKPSNFKIYKKYSVPDSKYITSYRVELVGKGLKIGEIVKVEFKD